ncbi:MAG: putative membrane protein YedE/YeeE [Motiliproteus sp.]|jgi:uncharacterized membrane protein YedE/YeeE
MSTLNRLLATLAAGTLFGFGLALSQMIDPAKVLNFLDIFGSWDPSLALVMAGGLAVNALLTPVILKRERPLFGEFFRLPSKSTIDKRIVIGGIIFGIGWGLAGYCPGPLITSLSFASPNILITLGAFVVGTFGTRWVLAQKNRQA